MILQYLYDNIDITRDVKRQTDIIKCRKDMIILETKEFNEILNDFLEKSRKESVKRKNRKELYNKVLKLEKATQLQKERFILYYNMDPTMKQKEKILYKDIAQKYNCSSAAVRYSICSVKNKLYAKNEKENNSIINIIK